MNNNSKIYDSTQSLLLVISLAAILGLMGWFLGGAPLALLAVGAVVILYLINPMVPPQVILRLQKVRRLNYHEAPYLYGMLQTLSQRAQLPHLPTLYYHPSNEMNAFTIGNRKNAAIAVTDGLLRHLDRNEFAAVMAHEISHLKHNDLRIMGFAALSSQLVQMLAFIGQLLLLINLPLLLLGQYTISWAAILLLIVAPSVSALLHLALSRTREYRADIGAADLMGDGRTLASALEKIETFQKRYVRALLWSGFRPVPAGHLLRTHPPTKERIKRLLGYTARRPQATDQNVVRLERISPQILSQMPRRWSWTN
jgi:heat shock protein HtpX